jgi:hypothetical protein
LLLASDEVSRAAQKIARAAGDYEAAIREFGQFVGRVIDYPAQHAGGLFGDAFYYARVELATRMIRHFDRLVSEQNVTNQRKVSFRIAYPILHAASVEDDEGIQHIFAQLLANAVNADSGVDVQKAFVEAVRMMSPLEAQILAKLVDVPDAFKDESQMIATAGLPDNYISQPPGEQIPDPPEPVAIAVSSLVRNGCLAAAGTWDGGSSIATVSVTPFGTALIKASRPPVR